MMKVILSQNSKKVKCITDVRSQLDDLTICMVTITANQKLKDDPSFNHAKYIKDNLE